MANDRDCESCKHHKEVCKNGIFYHSCESWDCEFEPKEDAEPCEDAISRQMVLDATVNKNSIWNNITNAKGENLEEIISQLPPINQMNKWIGAEVLDRIRNEMHATAEKHEDGVYYLRDEWVDEIIDKYAEGSGE